MSKTPPGCVPTHLYNAHLLRQVTLKALGQNAFHKSDVIGNQMSGRKNKPNLLEHRHIYYLSVLLYNVLMKFVN